MAGPGIKDIDPPADPKPDAASPDPGACGAMLRDTLDGAGKRGRQGRG